MIKINKKYLMIIGAVAVIIAAVIFWYFYSKNKSATTQQKATTTTSSTSTSSLNYYPEQAADNISISADNQPVNYYKEENNIKYQSSNFNTKYLSNLAPGLITSPNGQYAIGYFYEPEFEQYCAYLLSAKDNPKKLDYTIETVGMVKDNGKIIYYAEGKIAEGNYNRSSERTIVPADKIDSVFIGLAQIDDSNLLYWGQPSQIGGANMDELDINTGKITSLISDNTVIDARLAPNKQDVVVQRYKDNQESNWIYSLNSKQFTKQLPAAFSAHSCAWDETSQRIAYWADDAVYVLNIGGNSAEKIKQYSQGDSLANQQLGFFNNKITIYPSL